MGAVHVHSPFLYCMHSIVLMMHISASIGSQLALRIPVSASSAMIQESSHVYLKSIVHTPVPIFG